MKNSRILVSFVLKFFFALLAFFWLLPLIGVVVNSFRTYTDAACTGWWTAIRHPEFTLENYAIMLHNSKFLNGLKNSMLISVPTIFFAMFICSLTSYVLILSGVKYGKLIYAFLCILLIIPAEVTLAPTLVILKAMHLQNTYPGIWMSHTANIVPFGTFLIGSFMIGIPKDLISASKIDGAGLWKTYTHIILPLSLSSVASLAIFDFLWVWNDLLRALIIIPDPRMQPLTAVLANAAGGYGEHVTVQAAGAVLLLLPPLLVFLFLQKAFVNGVLAGSVKE